MHRLAEDLAREVVERDVDGGHRVQGDAAMPEVHALLVQVVPDRLDVERIAADQELSEPLRDHVRRRHLDRGAGDRRCGVRLPDARETLVGLDPHDEGVLCPVGPQLDLGKAENDRLDTGDAHETSGRIVDSLRSLGWRKCPLRSSQVRRTASAGRPPSGSSPTATRSPGSTSSRSTPRACMACPLRHLGHRAASRRSSIPSSASSGRSRRSRTWPASRCRRRLPSSPSRATAASSRSRSTGRSSSHAPSGCGWRRARPGASSTSRPCMRTTARRPRSPTAPRRPV